MNNKDNTGIDEKKESLIEHKVEGDTYIQKEPEEAKTTLKSDEEYDPLDYRPELEQLESKSSRIIKRALVITLILCIIGGSMYGMQRYKEWKYPNPYASNNEESATTNGSDTDSDLNVQIDNNSDNDDGKSLEEILGSDEVIIFNTNGSNDGVTDNSDSNSDSSGESISTDESNGESSLEGDLDSSNSETVSQEEIDKMIESKVAENNEPVESNNIDGLHNYYESVGESIVNNPEFIKMLEDKYKTPQ